MGIQTYNKTSRISRAQKNTKSVMTDMSDQKQDALLTMRVSSEERALWRKWAYENETTIAETMKTAMRKIVATGKI